MTKYWHIKYINKNGEEWLIGRNETGYYNIPKRLLMGEF